MIGIFNFWGIKIFYVKKDVGTCKTKGEETEDFLLFKDPGKYEFSNIDATENRAVPFSSDYFTLFSFSRLMYSAGTSSQKKITTGTFSAMHASICSI